MTPLEKLLRAAGAPPSEYAWASVALGRAEAAELIDHVVQLQENLDRAHARIAELEAAARRCADCGRAARELIATADADGGVVHLGPGCLRKRLKKDARRAEPLPIGGAR